MVNLEPMNLNTTTNNRIQAIAVKLVCGMHNDREINSLMNMIMPKLRFYIWNYIRNDEDTNDILQNTMEKIWSRLSLYKPQFRFTTWIFRIARNEALNWLNNRIYGVSDIDADYEGITNLIIDDFGEIIIREGTREDVLADIYEEIQRIAIDEGNLSLLEKDMNRRKFKEIAMIYDISENTVKTRVRAGRMKICEALTKKYPELEITIFDF